MPSRLRVAWLGLAAFFCLPASPVLADVESGVHPFLSSKYSIQLGGFFPSQDLTLRVDGSAGSENIDFDFDERLDLSDDHEIFALEFVWRFGKKWSSRMQFFSTDRQDTGVLEEDIEWEDYVITAGSSVTAGTSFKLARVFFARAFDSAPHLDYGVGVGLHWMQFGAFIEHDLITNFAETSAVAATAPLPNIGGWYYYSPSEKWYVGGRLDWLAATVGEYRGGITNFAAGVNYQMFDNVGIGVKYQLFRLGLDVDQDNWRGRVKFAFEGAFVYLSGSWN